MLYFESTIRTKSPICHILRNKFWFWSTQFGISQDYFNYLLFCIQNREKAFRLLLTSLQESFFKKCYGVFMAVGTVQNGALVPEHAVKGSKKEKCIAAGS